MLFDTALHVCHDNSIPCQVLNGEKQNIKIYEFLNCSALRNEEKDKRAFIK